MSTVDPAATLLYLARVLDRDQGFPGLDIGEIAKAMREAALEIAPECVTLEIDAVAPSPNTWKGRHWRHYHRLRRVWDLYVFEARVRAGIEPRPMERVHVHIVRQSWHVLDEDNLVASVKPIQDSLRSNGLIVDDDPAHLTLTVEQRRGKPKTMIEISSLTPSTPGGFP